MSSRRLIPTFVVAAIGVWVLVGSATAAAAPVWNLDIHHNETNFAPGDSGPGSPEYWFSVENVGPDSSSGPVTLTVTLPSGLTRREVRQANTTSFNVSWSCPGSPGDVTITCTTSTSIPRHTVAAGLVLAVNVDSGASGTLLTEATLSGGGAGAPVTAVEPTQISPAAAPFGIVPLSLEADFFQADGRTPIRKAGSHPDLLTVSFDFNSVAAPTSGVPENKSPSGNLHDLRVDFPPGFVGYPANVGECKPDQLMANACPRSSQVGRVDATVVPVSVLPNVTFTQITTPVYNMAHPKGIVSDLAFQVANNPIHVRVSLDPSRGYAIKSKVTGANETLPVFFQKMTLWGVPADPSHDSERCPEFISGNVSNECAAGVPEKPFLTLPSRCDTQYSLEISEYDSWQDQGVFGPPIGHQLPGQLTDCDKPPFEPSVEAAATSDRANTPTGLTFKLSVPQNLDPDEQATPPVKGLRLALPEGMTVSPTFATGLQSCTEAQIGLGSANPADCPDASRIGSVSVQTPVLEEPVEGSLYMAQQGANPFGSPLAIYLVLRDTEERGILVKISGRLDLDDSTGQITAVFEDLPQLPFEDVSVHLRGGDMAPLLSPPTCGSQPIQAQLTSWAQPAKNVEVGADLQVNGGANGSSCPSGLPGRPFGPAMNAGTLNPTAGTFSPFVFRLTRHDQDQELARLDTTLPSGLTAKIAGIPYCSEAAIAAISAAEGTGRAQLASPACPASKVGAVEVGVGAGASPAFFAGQAYLAGPYKDAPLSLAIVVPAVVGPFDFGNVVVRAGIKVDPQTAVVSVVSDPFPQIVHGVLLRVRDIRLRMDLPNMILNPTSCDRTAVNATAFGASGAVASLASPFQVGGCRQLGFKPRLSLRLKGGTERGEYPALRATLKARPGDANIARTSVALPRSEFLAQEHIRTICTRVQFAANACPKASVYGYAKAVTPLLDKPLQGPVYLRSSNNKLPDLVANLNGQLEITLVGRIDSKNQGIRTTFSVVPDAPVTRFTLKMQGGKKGLLVNSENICRRPGRALVKMIGHNGKTSLTQPRLAAKCRPGSRP